MLDKKKMMGGGEGNQEIIVRRWKSQCNLKDIRV